MSHAKLYNIFCKAARDFGRLGVGPDWLQAGRAQRGEYPDLDSLMAVTSWGNFQPFTQLAAGIELEPGRYIGTKANFPELSNISAIRADARLPVFALTTIANSNHFLIVDAREAVGFSDHMPDSEELKVLYGKLLGRLVEETASGRPHILEPDNTMQKVIARVEGGRLDEIRMSGKNRFYITVSPQEGYVRIVLLGIHGGDATTQRKFIHSLLDE